MGTGNDFDKANIIADTETIIFTIKTGCKNAVKSRFKAVFKHF